MAPAGRGRGAGLNGEDEMQTNVMFLDCPAYMDDSGAARCGLPAAVEYWYTVESSDGPLESAKIRCPRGHGFNGPVEYLTFTGSGRSAHSLAPGYSDRGQR
jgi:hypothetical protein